MRAIKALIWVLLAWLLTACGGGGEDADTGHYAGGVLTGLATGNAVVLTSGQQTQTLTADGTYRFGRFPSGTTYDVRAQSTSPDQVCEVLNGVGKILNADIDNVRVTCVAALKVGGTVVGYDRTSGPLVLALNSGERLTVSGNGAFQFAGRLPAQSSYSVSVVTQPTQAICALTNANAVLTDTTASQTQVLCEPLTGQVAFTVSGLTSPDNMRVQLNGSSFSGLPTPDRLVQLSSNGGHAFAAQIPTGSTYQVVIAQAPQEHDCTVSNGSGVFYLPGVSNITINCQPVIHSASIPVTVSGLSVADTLALRLSLAGTANNAPAQVIQVVANGSYAFAANLQSGAGYTVSLSQAPAYHTCTVVNGFSVFVPPQASTVQVNCTPNSIGVSVGVTITGLTIADPLVLRLDGSSLTGPVTSERLIQASTNGSYAFSVQLQAGATYQVILTPPAYHTCTLNNASGVFTPPTVGAVGLACVPNVYPVTIGVNISGMNAADPLVLQLVGSSFSPTVTPERQIQASTNGAYSFSVQMPAGATYQAVLAQAPVGHSCTLGNQSGTFTPPNVATMSLTCSPRSFLVSGTITLWNGETALMQLNGGETQRANGAPVGAVGFTIEAPFQFNTSVPFGSSYTVTVPEPPGFDVQEPQTCTITNGSGTMPASSVTNVSIACDYGPIL